MKLKYLTTFPLALSLAVGCTAPAENDDDDDDDDDASLVTVARRSAELSSQTAALAIIAADPLAGGVADENAAATRAAAAASSYFDEAGCIAAAIDPQRPNMVLLTFDDCDGPYGFADVSGQVAFGYSRAGTGLSVTVASVGALDVDGVPVQLSLTVGIPDLANPRTIVVETANRLDLSDLRLTLDGRASLTWDAALCFTLSADLTATAGDAAFEATIDGLHRCAGECPDGAVTLSIGDTTSGDLRTMEVIFDGDHTAEIIVTTPDSMRSFPVPILCS